MKQLSNYIIGAVLLCAASITSATCLDTGKTKAELLQLKTNKWQIADANQRQLLALDMLDCLSHPDPELRDEIAFEALSFWMRAELINLDTLHQIRQRLLKVVKEDSQSQVRSEQTGFAQPFAALVLAEVARVDRRKAFMTSTERQEMVEMAALYLSGIRDFRGYDEQFGWRHGVAHAADWMMQLSLNPALDKNQHHTMLNALAIQIRNEQHFYHYGEGERLMTPVFYLALRSQLSQEEWESWFANLIPNPSSTGKTKQASLARKHNIQAFLSALYINLQESKQTALQEKMLPIVIKSLKKLN